MSSFHQVCLIAKGKVEDCRALCEELGQYRTIRWQRRRCLFRHLLLADFSIYLQ